jgi:hypothetical protein
MNNFQRIALGQGRLLVLGLGHDFAVSFHRNLAGV